MIDQFLDGMASVVCHGDARRAPGGPSGKNWILRRRVDKLLSLKIKASLCGYRNSPCLRLGEIGGTPCMRSHILVHGATIKFCDNPFIFKNEIEKEGLPRDSTPDLGARFSTPTTPSVTSNY